MPADQELEVKLYMARLEDLEPKLNSLGAVLRHPRRLEINLRFDTPAADLSRSGQVLRLRRYEDVRVTYKGPSAYIGGVRSRREIEFTAGDFEAARHLLEALGYHVVFIYEKYRAAYQIDGLEVSLDELPYGSFVEIEGADAGTIRELASNLQMNWEARVPVSYSALFDKLRAKLDLPFRDLTFENFGDIHISPDELGVAPADRE
jgi:adenylate cyclase class 2